MTAHRRALHGLVVEIDDRVAGSPAAALFDAFPEPGNALPISLRLRLLPAPEPRPLPPGRPVFFHGDVRAVTAGGWTVLGDGRSTVAVSADGSAIECDVHEESLTEPHAFSHAFLLMAVLLALRHHGLFHLHAAALRSPSGAGMLVAANGGSGKSTVTLALAGAGFEFMGDDTVLVARRAGRTRLLALPRAFHVGEETARAFPALAPHLGRAYAGTGKRFLDAERAFGRPALREAGAPAAILFPFIGREAATRFAPVAPADALGRLIESSAFLAVDGAAGSGAQMGLLGELASGASAFRVELGRDLLEAPGAWAAVLERAIESGSASRLR